jgi:anti-sigma factor ChrR (cupin superfamily)
MARKCRSCASIAIFNGMCESCLEGLLENYADTEVRQTARITELLEDSIQRSALELDATDLIIALKDQLRDSQAAEAAAKREANDNRIAMNHYKEQQKC